MGRCYTDGFLEIEQHVGIRFTGSKEMHALMFTQSQIDRAVVVNPLYHLPMVSVDVVIPIKVDEEKLRELIGDTDEFSKGYIGVRS